MLIRTKLRKIENISEHGWALGVIGVFIKCMGSMPDYSLHSGFLRQVSQEAASDSLSSWVPLIEFLAPDFGLIFPAF